MPRGASWEAAVLLRQFAEDLDHASVDPFTAQDIDGWITTIVKDLRRAGKRAQAARVTRDTQRLAGMIEDLSSDWDSPYRDQAVCVVKKESNKLAKYFRSLARQLDAEKRSGLAKRIVKPTRQRKRGKPPTYDAKEAAKHVKRWRASGLTREEYAFEIDLDFEEVKGMYNREKAKERRDQNK